MNHRISDRSENEGWGGAVQYGQIVRVYDDARGPWRISFTRSVFVLFKSPLLQLDYIDCGSKCPRTACIVATYTPDCKSTSELTRSSHDSSVREKRYVAQLSRRGQFLLEDENEKTLRIA